MENELLEYIYKCANMGYESTTNLIRALENKENKLKKAIKQNLKEDKFQIIIYTSPPVTLCSVIKYTIKKYNAISFLRSTIVS